MDKYFKKELRVLQDKIYKALNIFEEENDIEPRGGKKKLERLNNKAEKGNWTRKIRNPLPFSDYIDRVVKNIEGLIMGLTEVGNAVLYDTKKEKTVQDLLDVKYSLLSMRFIKDKEYYEVLRQKMFKNLDIVKEIINYIENN